MTKEDKTKEKRAKLEQELGKLTYERAKLNESLNKNAQRCNEIATALESMDKE